MSADNGIYILKTKRTRICEEFERLGVKGQCWGEHKDHFVYRVAEIHAIDNFDYYKNNQIYNLGIYMRDMWGDSPVFIDVDAAQRYAQKMSQDIDFLEYGISLIDASEFIFYGDM